MSARPQRQSAVFGFTILYVEDIDRSMRFYEDAFGFERRFVDENHVYLEFQTGGTTLAFTKLEFAAEHCGPIAAATPQGPTPPSEIALIVADVDSAVDLAVAAGATLLRSPETKFWGQLVAYIRDPDGHLIQLATPPPPV